MNEEQRTRALRLADVLDSFYQREVLETASFLRELAAEPVPQGAIRGVLSWDVQMPDDVAKWITAHPPKIERAAEPVRVPMTDELAVSPQEVTEALRFVRTHLYAAQAQASPGDDSIIMRHVYDAYRRIADLTKEVELHGITGDAK